MDTLKTILQETKIQFEIIHHEKQIRTAQEGADYFGIKVDQTATTLILKSEKGYFAMIVSGNRGRVNLEDVSRILGCNQLKMATPIVYGGTGEPASTLKIVPNALEKLNQVVAFLDVD